MQALIIDDEEGVQKILTSFLQRYMDEKGKTCEVKRLLDPVEGLFELTSHGERYQVVLLDVRIPKLSGDEIFHTLEQVAPEVLDRILFVTGYPQDLLDRFPGKALHILQKPFRYESLAHELDKLLGS